MIVAVDTGGTKTLIATFSEDGAILETQEFPTPKNTDEYVKIVTKSVFDILGDSKPEALCVAVPGLVRDQIAVTCKNLGWRNFDVLGELKKSFPTVPMWLENDTNLGGVGASNFIQPAPKRCLYVTISTGVNGCLLIDGEIEPHLAESELGEFVIDYNGELTTWESLIDGKTIFSTFGKYTDQLTSPNDIAEMAKRISRGLLVLLPILRPDIVAVGGGSGTYYANFAEAVNEELRVLPEHYRCPIVTAQHPKEVVAYGCYFYTRDRLDS